MEHDKKEVTDRFLDSRFGSSTIPIPVKKDSAILAKVILTGITTDPCSGEIILQVFDPSTGELIASDPRPLNKQIENLGNERKRLLDEIYKQKDYYETLLRESKGKEFQNESFKKAAVEALWVFKMSTIKRRYLSAKMEERLQEARKFLSQLQQELDGIFFQKKKLK